MKVSIITPCYNAATFIEATIQSIQQQTLTDWELLVVDDGSTDNSADIVRSMAKDDNRIKLIQKENGGTASARKLGLEHAQGEYIQFLDADDQIDINKLLRQTTEMDASNLDVSYTDWCYISPSGEKEDIKGMNSCLIRILAFWGIFGTLPIHCFLYRRDFLEKHHITFTTAIKEREDWDFHIRIFTHKPRQQRLKGFCGAYYFRCPTGKTTCGSFSKLQRGNFSFLIYKIRHTHHIVRLLLLLRLSIGLIETTMLTVRHKMSITKDILPFFAHSFSTILIFISALLLLPISSIIFIIRIIWVFFHKK